MILLGAGHLAQVVSRDALNYSKIRGGKRPEKLELNVGGKVSRSS